MIGRHVLSDASIAPADEYIQRMLLRAYGRSVLVYKMYQVSFPRDVYRRSGALLK